MQALTLKTTGDLNLNTAAKGYQINGSYVLWHNNVSGSIYVGGAGNATSAGWNNTFVGKSAGASNGTGQENVIVGYQAGYLNGSNRKTGDTQVNPKKI